MRILSEDDFVEMVNGDEVVLRWGYLRKLKTKLKIVDKEGKDADGTKKSIK